MTRSTGYIPVSHEMSNFFSTTPIFKTRDSTLTFSLICLEAVIVCFLEGFVVMNHLALVGNCSLTQEAQGKSRAWKLNEKILKFAVSYSGMSF